MIVKQLEKGECNYLSDALYGYPYDYEIYAKDSLDPKVKILNELLEKVELTFEKLKEDWDTNKTYLQQKETWSKGPQ